jgi:chromosomal replication initiator protein
MSFVSEANPSEVSAPSSAAENGGEVTAVGVETGGGDGVWRRVCEDLRGRIGGNNFDRWFGRARATVSGAALTVWVENPIHQVWIESNYGGALADAVSLAAGRVIKVELAVSEAPAAALAPSTQVATPRAARHIAPAMEKERNVAVIKPGASGADESETAPAPRTLADAGLNARFSFDSFVVGGNSSYSTAVARAVAEKPGRIYNPLFFHGASGLGKTHLMQAIGREVLMRKKRATVRYVTCEQFTNEFIDAIKKGTFSQFRARYRKLDVLLIDDVHFLAGKDTTQEEFFHTFNELFNNQRQIVMASDRPPSEIRNLEKRLVSRFEWGLTTQIQTPDYETRLAILRRKQQDFDAQVSPEVMEFIAQNIKANVRKLEGGLMRVAAYVSLEGRNPEPDALRSLLGDVLEQEPARAVTVDRVQRAVAAHFDVRVSDLTGPRRTKNIAEARQAAMWLVRTLTRLPLTQIGEEFGNRDHGTVIHAVKVVDGKLRESPDLKRALDALTGQILAD